MAYVPDYDHDVFVSYAHLDDQGESAWVANLVRHLDTEVRQRLGTKDLRIWIDHSLDGNRPLTPEIMQAIRLSATLFVIMSPSYIASEWCVSGTWSPRGFKSGCAVRLQSEEERSRPRCAGDLSREGGKRAVARALPGEAVIEHHHLIGSTLPFSNQPGSRFQLGTRTYSPLWALVELLSKLTELALPLRAQAAESDFLHPVCDGPAAEARG